MPDEKDKISLANIKGGAAIEMFDLAMERIFLNIRDINTTLDKREITLKAVFAPDEDRSFARISFGVSTKMANQGLQKCNADIMLGQNGKPYAKERDVQLGLTFKSNVHTWEKKEANND